jgi:hypothetical protein
MRNNDKLPAKTISGHLFSIPGVWLGVAAGLVLGTEEALEGRSFSTAFGNAVDDCWEGAAKFGDKHHDKIVGGVLSGIARSVGANISGKE